MIFKFLKLGNSSSAFLYLKLFQKPAASSYSTKIKRNSVETFRAYNYVKNNFTQLLKKYASFSTMQGIHENISALQLKKRPQRKKRILYEEDETRIPGVYSVATFATAEEYNLERLVSGLEQQDLYIPKPLNETDNWPDIVYAVAKYQVGDEPREIFFFREGSVVFWNVTELESSNVLTFLKQYEQDSYSDALIQQEADVMNYKYITDGKETHIFSGDFMIKKNEQSTLLEKYALSNSMASSVKLGIWEASLNHYVDSIEYVTQDLKFGRKIKMSQEEVLRKHGELFALRHVINLSSDLLDTPDFYWDRDQLETLYQQTCNYFNISRRTRVMNEKINHCVELIELLSSHLSDKHHCRLEWMIIILIMVEVGFETIHYLDRYLH